MRLTFSGLRFDSLSRIEEITEAPRPPFKGALSTHSPVAFMMPEMLRVEGGVVLDGVEMHGPIVGFDVGRSACSVAQEFTCLLEGCVQLADDLHDGTFERSRIKR